MNHFGGDASWEGNAYDNFSMSQRPEVAVGGVVKHGQTHIYMIQNDGTDWTSFVDANQQLNVASGGVSLKDSPTIGFMYANIYEYFEGQIAEVLIFEDILTDQERVVLQAYLSKKWGLTARVDSDGDGLTDASDLYPVDATKGLSLIHI